MGLALRAAGSGGVRPVRPRPGRPLALYVCGPTVYDGAHVGHARTYLTFDLVRRQLRADGVRVRAVMNITDYEDKISDRAIATGTTWRRLARREERSFLGDLGRLGILPADVTPRASEHVAEMRAILRTLEKRGRTARTDGGLLFDPPRVTPRPRGELPWAHLVPEPGAASPGARELETFALWLPPHPGGPAWPSPWGPGSPGWHVECLAMARRYLGFPVDLHGGGQDLIFPHHFAENALSEALDHRPFSRRFLYGAFVTQGGAKMAKSTGQLVPLRSALDEAGPAALRWYLGATPYDVPLEWDPRGLESAAGELLRVRRALTGALAPGAGGRIPASAFGRLSATVARALRRDLGTSPALRSLSNLADRIGSDPTGRVRRGEGRAARTHLAAVSDRLGIPLL